MSELPLNILLLLSYDQLPPPDEEVSELADICARDGEVLFATTRNNASLQKGSEVAFYADGPEHFEVLATAAFESFVPIESADASSILSKHALYGARQPQRMRGLARLTQFALRPSGTLVDSLNGWMSDGRRLTVGTIPDGYANASVYYIKEPGNAGISETDQMRLWHAKCEELEDKYADTRKLWDQDIARRERLNQRGIEELQAIFEHDIAAAKKASIGGRKRNLVNVLRLMLDAAYPNVRILQDSAEVLLTNYSESRSLMQRLTELNADPMLSVGLRGGTALKGLPGWFRARFGDNLGRMYYRSFGRGRQARIAVLLSQKDEQMLDVKYLQSLRDEDLE